MKIEFHVHTKYSHDSLLAAWPLLVMCKLKGVECVAITDHNEIEGAVRFAPYLKKHGIKTIIGEEIFTDSGEIIGLFLTDRIEPGLSPRETVAAIKAQNGLVYIPHPYDEKRYKTVLKKEALEEISNDVDMIEMHNGRNASLSFSEKQKDIAGRLKAVCVVGSDAHTFFELGRNFCVADIDNTAEITGKSLLEAMKKAVFSEKKCLSLAHFATKIARALKMIFRGNFNGLYNAVKRAGGGKVH